MVKFKMNEIVYTFYEGIFCYNGVFVVYKKKSNEIVKFLPISDFQYYRFSKNRYIKSELLPRTLDEATKLLKIPTRQICDDRNYFDTWRICFNKTHLVDFLIQKGADPKKINETWELSYKSAMQFGESGSPLYSFSFPGINNTLFMEIGRVFQRKSADRFTEWFIIDDVIQ